MRLTADFWISALVKRVFSGGGFAAIARRGSPEAGAVFLILRDRMGGVTLYGPAPQTSYDSAKPDERYFIRHELSDEDALEARLATETRFDPDIWAVEIEPGREAIEELVEVVEG